jgi:hypothetical protein
MSLHILLCDEVLLYFIVRVEVIEIQIGLNFVKQIWKRKRIFYFFLAYWAKTQPTHRLGPASHSPVSPAAGHHGLADRRAHTCVAKWIRPIKHDSDPIGD